MKTIKLILTALLFFPAITSAAGISITPSKLDFILNEKKIASQEIVIANPTADVQLFEVSSDEFEKIIKSVPASFTLEAGGKKTVLITIEPSQLQTGQIISANLSVISRLLKDDGLKVGTGVKIPIKIAIKQSKQRNYSFLWLTGGTLLLLLAGLIFTKIKPKK
jgi:hypothetical protein